MFLKHSCKMKRFMDTAMHLIGLVLMSGDDEIFWNTLLHEDQFRQIHVEMIEPAAVSIWNGKEKPPSVLDSAHVIQIDSNRPNFVEMTAADGWYFTEEHCSDLYRSDLVPAQ